MGYLLRSAKGQISLLNSRVPIEQTLREGKLSEQQREKLNLAQEAKKFAEEKLFLKKTGNYSSFVDLGRPYVTYVVSASPKWSLKHHLWGFPIVGQVPYKGFFTDDEAKSEEESLHLEGLDTYRRGVSAYSTLGWFNDPILSSMLNYKRHDLANTIIHETVHATLYIKNSADFNERLATFIGNYGCETFFLEKEGPGSETVKKIRSENQDERIFSEFISAEIKELEKWYLEIPEVDRNEARRKERLALIQKRFREAIQPLLKSDSYSKFPALELNNARLLVYKTYVADLSDFEAVFQKLDKDSRSFMKLAEKLESEEKPEEILKSWTTKSKTELLEILAKK